MQLFDFDAHVSRVVESYHGDATTLANALGALTLGRCVGWRVLRVIYSSSSYSKYQKILGVQFRDVLPERGKYAYKSIALQVLDRIGVFWDFCRSAVAPPELDGIHRNLF